MPVGALRALIAGLVGFVAALILGRALRATESGNLAAFFSVALGVPLIVAMIFIVAAEALVPTGGGPQPVEIVLGARRAVARSRRYAQISRILVRPDRPGRERYEVAGGLPALSAWQLFGSLLSSHVREYEHRRPVAYHGDGQLGSGGRRSRPARLHRVR